MKGASMDFGETLMMMKEMVNEHEKKEDRKLLISVKEGRIITDDEYKRLCPYRDLEIIHIGYSFTKKEITAKLTEGGKRFLGV